MMAARGAPAVRFGRAPLPQTGAGSPVRGSATAATAAAGTRRAALPTALRRDLLGFGVLCLLLRGRRERSGRRPELHSHMPVEQRLRLRVQLLRLRLLRAPAVQLLAHGLELRADLFVFVHEARPLLFQRRNLGLLHLDFRDEFLVEDLAFLVCLLALGDVDLELRELLFPLDLQGRKILDLLLNSLEGLRPLLELDQDLGDVVLQRRHLRVHRLLAVLRVLRELRGVQVQKLRVVQRWRPERRRDGHRQTQQLLPGVLELLLGGLKLLRSLPRLSLLHALSDHLALDLLHELIHPRECLEVLRHGRTSFEKHPDGRILPVRDCQLQGCPASGVCFFEPCTLAREDVDDLGLPPKGGRVHGRLLDAVSRVHVRVPVDELEDDGGVASRGREGDRGPVLVRARLGVGAVGEQGLDRLGAAPLCGRVQRRAAPRGSDVDVGAVGEEELHECREAAFASGVERGGGILR
mmetsp:Transcript_20613/g.55020  ORF Transcript_20613/g.55020 Transcript_20613/m.55020 type:complete len:466 (+) Transcript_20613:22-1419(+)